MPFPSGDATTGPVGPRTPASVPTIDLGRRASASLQSPRHKIEPQPAPPPPARSKQARNPVVVVLNFLFTAALLGALVLGGLALVGRSQFVAQGPLAEPRTVSIPRGADLATIAGTLRRQGVIASDFIFRLGVFASRAHGQLKAGEYSFEPGVTMKSVMETLVSGRSILYGVTVPEGLTVQMVLARLAADDSWTGDVADVPAEGMIAPDTYKFTRGASRQEIVSRMAAVQKERIDAVWEKRRPGLPIADKAEFLTLASIVERETGVASERPMVAGVFINRLEKGMRLQSDPTFLYGVYGGMGKPAGKPVTQSDKDSDTPYNTYKVKGLPPGPIALPGLAALEAVANPAETDALYFVADGTGGHVFAATLDEHNRNVQRWRRIESSRKDTDATTATEAVGSDAPATGSN